MCEGIKTTPSVKATLGGRGSLPQDGKWDAEGATCPLFVGGLRITKCLSLFEESLEIQREIRQNHVLERIQSSSKEKMYKQLVTTTTITGHCSVRQNQCNKAGKKNMEKGDNIVIYEVLNVLCFLKNNKQH